MGVVVKLTLVNEQSNLNNQRTPHRTTGGALSSISRFNEINKISENDCFLSSLQGKLSLFWFSVIETYAQFVI